MRAPHAWAVRIWPLLAILAASCDGFLPPDKSPVTTTFNGIYVGSPKVYDDRTLQQQLVSLGTRLAQLTGLDQGSLTNRLGTLQGSSASQLGVGLQIGGLAMPGVTTTAAGGTPSVAQTVGTTTTAPPAPSTQTTVAPTGTTTVTTTPGTPSPGTSSQTVTTTPSSTLQTVTTAPTATPAAAPLPSPPAYTLPSTFGMSALDTLNEEMELSYEMINLQLLLQGSLNDDYTPGGLGKRHVTLGFPISITTPPEHLNDVAEVEISVCNSNVMREYAPATLETIIPREKTYNVASLVSSSVQLGAGAIIGNIISVGGSFFSGHETYRLVQQQDTVALQRGYRESRYGTCPPATATVGHVPEGNRPLTFAWQFRPVLGQETIQQGMRTTFAQISLAPGYGSPIVTVSTCWLKYDPKSGIASEPRKCNVPDDTKDHPPTVKTDFDTTHISDISQQTDNGDGTMTVQVEGTFPTGTRVDVGLQPFTEISPGFENVGNHIRLTVPSQALALHGARLVSPDGSATPIILQTKSSEPYNVGSMAFVPGDFARGTRVFYRPNLPNIVPSTRGDGLTFRPPPDKANLLFQRPDGSTCQLPTSYSAQPATVTPFSDTQALVTVPLLQCTEIHPPGQPYHLIAILGSQAFGLSDAPFKSSDKANLTFVVPYPALQGQQGVLVKRLFLGDAYQTIYHLGPPDTTVSSITVLGSSQAGVTFAIRGSGLLKATFSYPPPEMNKLTVTKDGDTFMSVSIKTADLTVIKQLVLQPPDNGEMIPILLPAASSSGDASGSKSSFTATILESLPDTNTTIGISGSADADLAHATVSFPDATAATTKMVGDVLTFPVETKKLTSIKSVILVTPASWSPVDGTTASPLKTPAGPNDRDVQATDPFATPIVDQSGKHWTITKDKDAQVAMDGTPEESTHDVVELAYVTGMIWERSGNLWRSYHPATTSLISLPEQQQSGEGGAKAKLDPNASIQKGSTTPFKITGTNLKLVASVSYLRQPLQFSSSTEGTFLTFDPPPASLLAASPGVVEIQVRFTDGTSQQYPVTIKAAAAQ